jgi:membrane protein implicated in regulation of membrane protease activity
VTPASLWLIGGAILLAAEMLTGELTLASLALGCLAGALLAYAGFGLGVQFTAATVLAIVATIGLAPWLRRKIAPPCTPSPSEGLVGSHAEVTESLTPGQRGTVKLHGVLWQADSVAAAPVGSQVIVLAVEGARLKVLPANLLNEPSEPFRLPSKSETSVETPQQKP